MGVRKKIKKMLIDADLSQRQLARRLCVGQNSLSNALTRYREGPAEIKLLYKAFRYLKNLTRHRGNP